MKTVLEAAGRIQSFLEFHQWNFCFIGGIALQAWGRPRNTNDADLTLLTGLGAELDFIEKLLEEFEPRITQDPIDFFLRQRVVLIFVGVVGIDISLGAMGFEELAVGRAAYREFIPGLRLRVCSAEDLIVFKAFANRLRDWADIENVLRVQTGLDWNYIENQLFPLVELKEEPEIISQLNSLRKKIIDR